MTSNGKNRLPPELVTTTCLSGGLAIVLSLTNIVLSILVIVYRQNCSVAETQHNGAEYFLIIMIKTYILHEDCAHSLQVENLTKAESVFILSIIILVFAFINFLTAVTVISVVNHDERIRNVDVFIYVYLGSSLALLVVDITLGVHFGMDHEYLKKTLNSNSAGFLLNYDTDMIRLGALLLMSTALKGYIGHAMNIVLLVLLTVYVVQYQRTFNELDHSIHKLSVLRAFEPSKRMEEPWSPVRNEILTYSRGPIMNGLNNEDELRRGPMRDTLTDIPSPQKRFEDPWVPQPHRNEMLTGYPRGGQSNPAFNGDGYRSPAVKESSISDRPLDRSQSWLHNSGAGMGSRPFSYLEDRQRPMPVKSPTTPANEPQWRRDAWVSAPPVPEPDYSPPPRKLKSALKSNYV
ncbi:uncharacterized protein LOC123880270 [Maniola jurtina]|uniref:uncharacterized protein LOC123880270 n=1 Tax=Maniola jurtina TaxID=191418 RepID=UPI001E68BCBC|nr:uncharacterized protein LOC123880270 [Maniola jurtina]XP_045784268.1 uncharacterized protein LOC123880270 [Maniola jurtina]